MRSPHLLAMTTTMALWTVVAAAQSSARRPDVRFLPTPQNVVDAMLEFAEVTSADVVYDLGSGDGRIPITAARRTSKAATRPPRRCAAGARR